MMTSRPIFPLALITPQFFISDPNFCFGYRMGPSDGPHAHGGYWMGPSDGPQGHSKCWAPG